MATLVHEGYRLTSYPQPIYRAALLAYQCGLEMILNGWRTQELISDAL